LNLDFKLRPPHRPPPLVIPIRQPTERNRALRNPAFAVILNFEFEMRDQRVRVR